MSTTLLISTFPPFPSLTLTLPSDTPISEVKSRIIQKLPALQTSDLSLGLNAGAPPSPSASIGSLCRNSGDDLEAISGQLLSLRLNARLRGGKGGFGSQLRAAGGRMSSQKTSNNDSCRDLNGRRLSTIKEAKALAEYLESEPERKKAQQEAQKAKLEALERKLGIAPGEKGKEVDVTAGVKRRFDDTEYLEQSRDIVDNVKNAVAAGLLKKKKKKAKSDSPEASEPVASSSKTKESDPTPTSSSEGDSSEKDAKSDEKESVTADVLTSAATAPAVAVAAASLAAVGA